ncbi:hypothetical protein PJO48_29930, partial [Mycobacterium kansasii]
ASAIASTANSTAASAKAIVDNAASAFPTNDSLAKLSATASSATAATSSYAASAFASNSQASDLAAKVKAANDAVISA